MSIKNNKEITLLPKKKNRKIILVIEDEYDWCFPDCIWQYIKDFVGIFSKVNCIDKPFLRNIRFAIEYETPGRFIQKYINHMSLDPETKLVSEALVASGVLVENYNLTNLTLTKQIYNRCVKDPTYCRLQAAKWFQERAPKRKGVIYPTRFASYDLEDLWDVSPFHYNKNSIYAKPLGPIFYREKIRLRELAKTQAAARAAGNRWMGGVTRVTIAQMREINRQAEEDPTCFPEYRK